MAENISNYINSLRYGSVAFIFEIVLSVIVLSGFLYMVFKHVQSKKMIVLYITNIVFLIASLLFGVNIGLYILIILFVLMTIGLLVYYIPELKQKNVGKSVSKQNKQYLNNQEVKEELINTLIKTVGHLGARRIGAIITIEREHSLNTLVEGSVAMDAIVTFELLTTIFHPNTALHDGAVIIRGDRIKCSSAFYQPSQKKDIPQHYGSRHRAAVGISEQSDAFTIVVSEETGRIATTIDGTITGNVSLESLKQTLDQKIIVKDN